MPQRGSVGVKAAVSLGASHSPNTSSLAESAVASNRLGPLIVKGLTVNFGG